MMPNAVAVMNDTTTRRSAARASAVSIAAKMHNAAGLQTVLSDLAKYLKDNLK